MLTGKISASRVKNVLKECSLYTTEQALLRTASPKPDPKIFFDTKKCFGAVVKFLGSLPQLFYW